MRVFLAYGGTTGRELAEQIRQWLPKVLQGVEPFFAPWDTAKGSRWREVIDATLQDSAAAVLCLTRDTLRRPWILFEAGAISQRARVFPLLFEVPPDVLCDGPLEQYHATAFARDDLYRLVEELQRLPGVTQRSPVALRRTFDRSWPRLSRAVRGILAGQTRELAEQVLGGWWERITSPEQATAISFLQIQPEPDRKRLRLVGTAYGRDGRPTATWESQIVLVDPDRSSLVYLWSGDRLTEPCGPRRGIGQITFLKSQAGTLNAGQGFFDDTDMRTYYLRKTFQLARAGPDEESIMTSTDGRRKAARVQRRLKQMD